MRFVNRFLSLGHCNSFVGRSVFRPPIEFMSEGVPPPVPLRGRHVPPEGGLISVGAGRQAAAGPQPPTSSRRG